MGVEPTRLIEVSPADDGARLDALLARELHIGRRHVRRLLERGAVRLDGEVPPKGVLLRPGDRVEVAAFRHPDMGPVPDADLVVPIIAESRDFVAVDKPAGIASQPLEPEERGTALSAVLALRPEVGRPGEGLERGLVHRLDRETSGVLVLARTQAAWEHARAAFEARTVHKRYVARVHGRLAEPLELSLRMVSRGPRVRVVEHGGRAALTRVSPLEPGETSSLVEVEPATGVRHQIRAALAHAGHPVLGDALYGSHVELERHLLHAANVRIPGAGEIEAFEAHAPVPPGFSGG